MKRVLVPAAAAILVLACAAAAVWIALVRGVAAALPVQAQLAQALLDARTPVGEAFARTLRQPGVHVFVMDRQTGLAIDAGSGGTVTHALFPPDGRRDDGPPSGPPPGPPNAPFNPPPAAGPFGREQPGLPGRPAGTDLQE